MNEDMSLLVKSCPLCSIFLNPKENIKTKLYWPESIDEVSESEFVILDCDSCNVPLIVVNEHITEVTSECWGRILYRCRILFGKTVRLRTRMLKIRDHAHFHKAN